MRDGEVGMITPEILALSQALVLLAVSVASNYWLETRASGEASFTAEAMEFVLFP